MPPSTNPAFASAEGAKVEGFLSPQELFRSRLWDELSRAVDAQRSWTEQRHLDLVAIPAPTFHERPRAEWMEAQFRALGLKNVRVDEAGNVLGDRPGRARQRVWITAHLDTVFPPGTPIPITRDGMRIFAPGISDNGSGLSALLTLINVLQQQPLETGLSLRFVANVGEEGEGDLCGIRHLFSGAEARKSTAAVLVLDGPGAEHITNSSLGSRRYLLEVKGPGGHSWNDFGRVNPIHALAGAIRRVEGIALSTEPRSTISVGLIEGGTTVNSIPPAAWMKVDIRSTSMAEIERLSKALLQATRSAVSEEMQRAEGTLELRTVMLGERPAAPAQPGSRLVDALLQADQLLGIRSQQRCSSTDANVPLALGIDAVAIGAGGNGGGAHTLEEWYDPQGRELGIKRALLALLSVAGVELR